MENLKIDLDQDEVFVFTPKGRVITLPAGATPIDFAYSIHTEVGHACIGARVNGRLVPLDSTLLSGDTVEIFTSKVEGAGAVARLAEDRRSPTGARTRSASGSRVSVARTRSRPAARSSSRPCAARACRCRRSQHVDVLDEVGRDAELRRPRRALRRDRREPRVRPSRSPQRVGRSAARGRRRRHEEQLPITVRHAADASSAPTSAGVHVEGLDDVMVRLSRCCTPVPGDEIMGFVTRGRGVSVHRADCANAVSLSTGQGDRLIDVEWDSETARLVRRRRSRSRRSTGRGCSRDVARALADHHVNIIVVHTTSPAPTASPRCASTSSSATRAPRLGASARSSRSTASTTPIASCRARAASHFCRCEAAECSDCPHRTRDHNAADTRLIGARGVGQKFLQVSRGTRAAISRRGGGQVLRVEASGARRDRAEVTDIGPPRSGNESHHRGTSPGSRLSSETSEL